MEKHRVLLIVIGLMFIIGIGFSARTPIQFPINVISNVFNFTNLIGVTYPADNITAGTFGSNAGGGVYTFPSNLMVTGNIHGSLGCGNITGSTSNLCTLTDTKATTLPFSNISGSIYLTFANISGAIALSTANITGYSAPPTQYPLTNITGYNSTQCSGTQKVINVTFEGGSLYASCGADVDTDTNTITTSLPYSNISGSIFLGYNNLTNSIYLTYANISGSVALSYANISGSIYLTTANITGYSPPPTSLPYANITGTPAVINTITSGNGTILVSNGTTTNIDVNTSYFDDRYLNSFLQLFFFNVTDTSFPTYTVMNSSVPNPSVNSVNPFSLGTGEHTLTQRIDTVDNIRFIQAGTYHQHTTINLSTTTRTIRIHSEIYIRNTTGHIRRIGTSTPSDPLISNAYQDVDWVGTIPSDQTLASGEYLVMILNATITGSGVNASFNLIVGGTTGAHLLIGTGSSTLTNNIVTTSLPASNITSGTFNGGNYTFPNHVNVNSNLTVGDQLQFNQSTTAKIYSNGTHLILVG